MAVTEADATQAVGALETSLKSLPEHVDSSTFLEKLTALITYLQDSEKLLIISIKRAQGEPYVEALPETGSAEFGWLPYLFREANKDTDDPLVKAFQGYLHDVFGKYTETAEKVISYLGIVLDPQMTAQQWQFLENHLQSSDVIAADGTIVGGQKYEDLDKEWLYTVPNYLYNLLFKAKAEFTCASNPLNPFNHPIGEGASQIKVAIIGDWGTGSYATDNGAHVPAMEVLQAVENLQPDYVIHLGDVYYCGTQDRPPSGEEQENLVALWPAQFKGKSLTLNSNHEMYGGAEGYFNIALKRGPESANSPFSLQQGYSYFALEFDPFVIVGIDAAYFDTSALYMTGGISTVKESPDNPQLLFLQQIAKQYHDKQIILMSHQTPMSTDGKTLKDYPLLEQVQATGITPAYWYWGHIHLGLVYGEDAAVTKAANTKCRCVGHSAIPFGAPWGLNADGNVIEFIARTAVE